MFFPTPQQLIMCHHYTFTLPVMFQWSHPVAAQ